MKKKIILVTLLFLTISFFAWSPKVCLGDWKTGITEAQKASNLPPNTVEGVIMNVLQWILGIAAALIVLVIIISGTMMVVSAGSEMAKLAKTWIMYALIGLAIILLSWTIMYVIYTFFI